jgi:hypothetical protein
MRSATTSARSTPKKALRWAEDIEDVALFDKQNPANDIGGDWNTFQADRQASRDDDDYDSDDDDDDAKRGRCTTGRWMASLFSRKGRSALACFTCFMIVAVLVLLEMQLDLVGRTTRVLKSPSQPGIVALAQLEHAVAARYYKDSSYKKRYPEGEKDILAPKKMSGARGYAGAAVPAAEAVPVWQRR